MATIEFLLPTSVELADTSELMLTTDPQAESGLLISAYALESFSGWGQDQPKSSGYIATPPVDGGEPSAYGTLLLKPGHDALVERSSYLSNTVKVPQSEASDLAQSFQLYRATL